MGEEVTERAISSKFRSIRVFISYRREDTKGFARALKSDLSARYGKGQIFMDLDDITPGEVWVDVIQTAVSECDAMVALIGKGWLLAEDDQKRPRLDNPLDPVRLEIETAFSEKLRVIPALLEGASMPPAERLPEGLGELPRIQALAITDDWEAGLSRLVKALDKVVATHTAKTEDRTRPTEEEPERRAEDHARTPPKGADPRTKEPVGKSPPISLGGKRKRLLSAVLFIALIGAATAVVIASMSKSPTTGTVDLPESDRIYNQPRDEAEQRLEEVGLVVHQAFIGCSNSTEPGYVRRVTLGANQDAGIIYGKPTDEFDEMAAETLSVGDEVTVWHPSSAPCTDP